MHNSLSHAAKAYKTNFVNHFTLLANVLARVRKVASHKLFGVEMVKRSKAGEAAEAARVGHEPLFNVLCAVETAVFAPDMHPLQREVASTLRTSLGLPDGQVLKESWLRDNIRQSIRFALGVAVDAEDIQRQAKGLWRQKKRTRRGAARGVKWIPTHRCARLSIKLDASDLVKILMPYTGKGGGEPDDSLAVDIVRGFFRQGIERVFGKRLVEKDGVQHLQFTGTIDTDGTSASLHFGRPRPPRPPRPDGAGGCKEAARIQVPRLVLLVDPGRINLVTMTALLDGKPCHVADADGEGKRRRMAFKLTARHLYSASGSALVTVLQRKRRTKAPELAALDAELSKASLKTGNPLVIARYLAAVTGRWDAVWSHVTSKRSARTRFRARAGKARVLSRFFSSVQRALDARFGKEVARAAVVVWGAAKVSPSGRGNLTVPTQGAAQVAARFWPLHPGDEYRTSSACSAAGCHCDLTEVRLKASRQVTLRVRVHREGAPFKQSLRHGFVHGIHHSRLLRRHAEGKRHELTKQLTVRTAVRWRYDGHGGESEAEKKEKKTMREAAGEDCRYVRGLRFCQECGRLHDRDMVGCDNIGIIWLCHQHSTPLPAAFDRAAQRARRARERQAEGIPDG